MQFRGFITIVVLLFFCNMAIQAQEKKDTSYKFTLIKERRILRSKISTERERAGHSPVPPLSNLNCYEWENLKSIFRRCSW